MRSSCIRTVPVCVLLLFLFVAVRDSSCSSFEPRRKLAEFTERIDNAANVRQAINLDEAKQFQRVFYPSGYGADPTGKSDSFTAIMSAVNDAIKVPNGELLPGIGDMGGVVIDLLGGDYSISQPLRLPPNIGNILIRGGTIRASSTFPGDRHLIELWSPSSKMLEETNDTVLVLIHPTHKFGHKKAFEQKNGGVGIYYEDITFRDILFDSSMRGGGLFVVESARIRIDHCFFIHFTTQGILVQRGHETYISSSFLGQQVTVGGSPNERQFSGTGILLRGNDNAITDTVIFSAGVGIEITGQANMLTGVHCYNKATAFGGVGILVRLPGFSQTRIDNCYLDYTALVLEDPVQVHVTNNFFLGNANIVLKSVKGRISALNIVDNMFAGWSAEPTVKLDGTFTDIDQVVVDRNNVNGAMILKSTVAKATVGETGGSTWAADFRNILLFPSKIDHVQYSFSIRQPGFFPKHMLTDVSGNVVVVQSEESVDHGVVSIVVDQYNLPGEICAGTLRASSTFPVDRHLIEIWAPTSEKLQETNSLVIYPPEFGNKKESGENGRIFYEGITFQNIYSL